MAQNTIVVEKEHRLELLTSRGLYALYLNDIRICGMELAQPVSLVMAKNIGDRELQKAIKAKV